MAAKTTTTFDSLMKELRAGQYRPLYILMGEEPYYIDLLSAYIADHALQPEERDFNQTVLYGLDTTAAEIADLAKGYPMMAERQVIIVREAQNLNSWEKLEKYAEHPMPTTVLVICHKNGTLSERKAGKLLKLAAVEGAVFESKKKRENELPSFVENYLKSKGATVDPKAAHMIVEHIGADLSRMVSEMDKVLISLPEEGRRVTPEIVEREIGVSKDYNSFELRDAIVSKDSLKAFKIVKYLDSNPRTGSVYAFLPFLYSFFQNLMVAYYAPNNRSEESVAQALDLRSSWAARPYMMAMRNYSAMKTLQIISKFREIDAKTKGLDNPNTGANELMKELIFFILN